MPLSLTPLRLGKLATAAAGSSASNEDDSTIDNTTALGARDLHVAHCARPVIVRSVARLRDIVVDCERPAALARWWAATIDGYRVAPYDDAEISRLAALGVTDLEDDPTVLVEPTSGSGIRLFFQKVPEPKQGKNRLHLDLLSDAGENEVRQLLDRGAREQFRVGTRVTLADPEGNEFCIDVPR
jgi:Glyoxalase-like domain